ncbi:hypothetical protein [Clostridium estertheticum]|uniref:hypothetical protein n=1 Tax=Clostridium estertheticum TaxID=238834 RepID=UPI001C6EC9D7|nr:hypothetical protein [Clostridium estertheticum]MBW9152285.1 hypothetical protein [Clostridium estertheticum]MBX4260891.1 hypothetical protein [Clostridium estertheticum]WLC71569.1 hypothetical protein KTC96_06040 [Clostridium estertheticum]WLC82852.1 hypothetical protein KTC97_12025 [Clostridium estertheticum]
MAIPMELSEAALSEYSADTSLQIAGVCIAVLPIIILFSCIQKYFVEGISSTGIKG